MSNTTSDAVQFGARPWVSRMNGRDRDEEHRASTPWNCLDRPEDARDARSQDCRATCPRYAGGIAVVQVGWLLRLFLPRELSMLSLCVLALAELGVPLLAERTGQTPWHAEHMAERYGLFTLIVLGESNGVPTMMIRSALLNA